MRRRVICAVVAVLAVAGTAVAFARPARTDLGVLVIDASTGARERITATDGRAAWSRDGSELFVGDDRGFTRFAPDGRRIAKLSLELPEINDGEIAVSPDGRRLAYLAAPRDSSHVNTGDLVVSALDGRRPVVRLTRARGTPAWSPDGKYLAVSRWSEADARGDDGPPARIAVVAAGGRRRAPLDAGRGLAPRWLPDGRLLVLDASTLAVTRVGDRQRRVVLDDVRPGDDTWELSPDGTQLAVAAAGQGDPRYHLTLVDLASEVSRRLSDEPTSDVRWSPDGTHLAVVVGDRILLLDPAGSTRELTRVPGRALAGLAWSPDGRHLAVSASVPHHGD